MRSRSWWRLSGTGRSWTGRARSSSISMIRFTRSTSVTSTSVYSASRASDPSSRLRSWTAPRIAPSGFRTSWARPTAMRPAAASVSPRRTSASSWRIRERSRRTATAPSTLPSRAKSAAVTRLTATRRFSPRSTNPSASERLSPVEIVSPRRRTRPRLEPRRARGGDHRRVVRAEPGRRDVEGDPVLGRLRGEPRAQRAVRRHAAREDHALDARAERGLHGLAHEHLHDRGLKGRGDVSDLALAEGRVALHVERRGRLETAEREVRGAVGHLRQRERDRLRIARLRRPLDGGPAGEPEPEQLGDLVEGLTRGVVTRLADERVRERRVCVVEGGVAAGDDEGEEWVDRGIVGEERGVDVALEVVDADEGLVVHVGEGLRQ